MDWNAYSIPRSGPRWAGLPHAPCVYILFFADECIYVGSTQDLRQRITSHALKGRCDRLDYAECRFSDLRDLEQATINIRKPKLNKLRAGWRSYTKRYSIWDDVDKHVPAVACPRGVYAHPSGQFKATITTGRRSRHLGYFQTPELAHAAYFEALREKVCPNYAAREFARSA